MSSLAAFSRGLEEGSEDAQIRIWAFEKAGMKWPPSFKHGSGIMIRPSINIDTIAPVANPTYHIRSTIPQGAEIRSVNTLGKLRADDKELFARLEDPLYLKDLAYSNHFMIITINGKLDSPIKIDIDIEDQVISQFVIKASKDCKASILLNSKGIASYTSRTLRIIQEPYSNIELLEIDDYDLSTTSFNRLVADQQESSNLTYNKICLGSDYSSTTLIGNLVGVNATIEANVLFAGSANQKFDIYTEGHHLARQTKCNLVTRGVLGGKAKALSRGLIKIDSNASGSEGYEKQDCMLLSCQAEADAIPNLEIGNHDVKCSHGSSIGEIDLDKVFYLMSRGMSEEEAKEKIVEGYFRAALKETNEEVMMTLSSNLSRIFRK